MISIIESEKIMLFLIILSAISAIISVFIGWDKDKKLKNRLLICNCIVFISIAITNQLNMYYKDLKQQKIKAVIKQVDYRFEVYKKLYDYDMRIANNIEILSSPSTYPAISSYVSWSLAMENEKNKVIPWEAIADDKAKDNLQNAKQAFYDLQNAAKDVTNQYPINYDLIPAELKELVSLISSLRFIDCKDYFCPYDEDGNIKNKEISKLLGKASGKVTAYYTIYRNFKYDNIK